MGADIHGAIFYYSADKNDPSVNQRFNDRRDRMLKPDMDRDYWLFALMGYEGRADIHAIIPSRGQHVPEVSVFYRRMAVDGYDSDEKYWDEEKKEFNEIVDRHSFSWMNLEELYKVQAAYSELECEDHTEIDRVLALPIGKEAKARLLGEAMDHIQASPKMRKMGPEPALEIIIGIMEVLEQKGRDPIFYFWFDN